MTEEETNNMEVTETKVEEKPGRPRKARTSICMSETLLTQAQELAKQNKTSVSGLVERALSSYIKKVS